MALTITGLRPKEDQRRQAIMLDRLTMRHERRIRAEIARAMYAAAKAIENRDAAATVQIATDHQRRMGVILEQTWRTSIAEFERYFTQAAPKHVAARLIERKDILQDLLARDVFGFYVQRYGGTLIQQITTTTMADINAIVAEGFADGLTEKQLATAIRRVAPVKSASRSQTIARTETHRASQFTAAAIAQTTAAPMLKQWVPAGGERTRTAHAAMAGAPPIPMDQPFIVDGEALMYPGDPNGSAGNTINCRCIVVYVFS